jgi:hypothetical protein
MARPDQQFHKALFLLDRGDIRRGEALLREALAAAEREGDLSLSASARCCLGELLIRTGRRLEAEGVLAPLAALDEHDDQFSEERRRALELLSRTPQPE